MPDFNARTDSVNVEQIMDQIRERIREKRGVDYEEQQVQELARTSWSSCWIREASRAMSSID